MENETSQYSQDAYALANRIVKLKIRLLTEHPFFGLLAQHVSLAIDTEVETACTDGEKIFFGLEFSKSIGDGELYFVFFHELMHIVYKHCFRAKGLNNELYNIASDIVINSVLLDELKLSEINVLGSDLMHKTPDGKEGRNFTAEEVYAMLVDEIEQNSSLNNLILSNDGVVGVGGSSGKNGEKNDDKSKQSKENKNGKSSSKSNEEKERNSNEKGDGEASKDEQDEKNGKDNSTLPDGFFFDNHSKWGENKGNELNEAKWQQRIYDAVKTLENSSGWGSVPALAQRMVEEIKNPPIDWRSVLINFIQTDVYDYSFSPPDKRFAGSDFLLPDFNEREDAMENVWIAIDASGSISDRQIALALNEIKGAIEQFNDRFTGWVSFFDYSVTKPIRFESADDIKRLKVYGGGGTSFENIFKAKQSYFPNDDLSCIIIITDGYALWPKEEVAEGIPVLWLFNNLKVTPPWGIVARMNIKER